MTDNITTSPSTPTLFNKESIKQSLIKNSNFNATAIDKNLSEADKIVNAITEKLKKDNPSKKSYTEEDIFKAADSIYGFKNGANYRLLNAIDLLDGETNIQLSEGKALWISKGAVIDQTDEQGQLDDSRDMVYRSINSIKIRNQKANEPNKEIRVQDILFDLSDQGVIKEGTQGFKNQHLYDNLVAMRDQGVTANEIREAIKDDKGWDKLIGTVKKTEFQRELIQDSIKNIKKPEFTVDDIIEDLEKRTVIAKDGQGQVTKNKSLYDTLVAIKNANIDVEGDTKTDTDWNKLIGRLKSLKPITK